MHCAVHPPHPDVCFAGDICLALLCAAVAVNWWPLILAAVPVGQSFATTQPRSISPVPPPFLLPHVHARLLLSFPPLVSGLWYFSLQWTKLSVLFHPYSLHSVLKQILPAGFEVLDWDQERDEVCTRELEPKSFLQLHRPKTVAKPLTGSLERGAPPPDYMKSQMMLINWILKGRVFIFSSAVAERVLVQAVQLRETQILFLSATDLWESTQNYLSFLCLMVPYLK